MTTRRLLVSLLLSVGILVVPAAASGGPGNNPNALLVPDVECPETGLSFDVVVTPTLHAPVGIGDTFAGVATSQWVTTSDGTPLFELADVPGRGLDGITVWCFWPEPSSPTGFVGSDVLFRRTMRP
jgi:hypothetical protein